MLRLLFFTFFLMSLFPVSAQRKAVPLLNGEAYRVDRTWFDPKPDFIGFYELGIKDGWDVWSNVRIRLEDSRGFLWLSNESFKGLVRYDGALFHAFTANPQDSTAMPTNQIEGMVEDKTGLLWIATRAGLVRYDPRTGLFKTFRNTADPARSVLNAILLDQQDHLWVSTNGQVFEFDRTALRFVATGAFTVTDYTQQSSAFKSQLEWLGQTATKAPDGSIWTVCRLPTDNSLVLANVRPDSAQVVCYPMLKAMEARHEKPDLHYTPDIAAICPDTAFAGLWIGGWFGGLRYFDLRTKRWTQFVQQYDRIRHRVGADMDYIHNIHRRADGKLWLNTAQFITLFDPATRQFSVWTDEKTPGTIDWKERKRLFWGRQGRIWAAYKTLSVHDPKAQMFQRLPRVAPPVHWVHGRHTPASQQTWLVYGEPFSHNIALLDEKTGQFELNALPEAKKMIGSIADVCPLGQQLWVIGLNDVLVRVDRPTGRTTHIPIPPDTNGSGQIVRLQYLRKIVPAADGGLWLTSSEPEAQTPLLHFMPATGRFRLFRAKPGGIPFPQADYLFTDRRGRVWIASEGTEPKGVACLDPVSGQVTAYDARPGDPHSLTSNYVKNMAEDKQGRIWMATRSGVCWFDERLPIGRQINQIPGFSGNVEHIVVDKNDNIWISGFAGVFLYKPATGVLRTFGPKNGVYLPELPLYQQSDGRISLGGLYCIHPDSIPVLTETPKVYLTDLRIFEQPWKGPQQVDFTQTVTLAHDDNFFTLHWSAIHFTNAEQNQYAYQLTGIDTGWVHCGLRNTASYTKLQPGRYTFHVKAANRDGIWGAEKTLQIVIQPAWYQTLWFKMALMLAILGATYLAYRLRLRQIQMEAALQQKEAEMRQKESEFQQRLAEAQIAALRAQMNPHFIFNSLSSINRFIQFNEPDVASNYLTKFSRLIRLILDNSRENTISLQREIDTCRLYLELESLRFAGQFSFQIEVESGVDPEQVQIPPSLLQPYLENAIWHGLMQKEDPDRQLKVFITGTKQILNIVIEDNGVGREKSRALKSKSANRHKSHGLHLTKERMDLSKRSTGILIEVNIEDIINPENEVIGTKVTMVLQN